MVSELFCQYRQIPVKATANMPRQRRSYESSLLRATGCTYSFTACTVVAQNDLYDNGPTNGTVDAYTINLARRRRRLHDWLLCYRVGVNLCSLVVSRRRLLESAEVSITSEEFGGTTYSDGIVNFTQSGCVTNQLGFSVCNESGILGSPAESQRWHLSTTWLRDVVNTAIPFTGMRIRGRRGPRRTQSERFPPSRSP